MKIRPFLAYGLGVACGGLVLAACADVHEGARPPADESSERAAASDEAEPGAGLVVAARVEAEHCGGGGTGGSPPSPSCPTGDVVGTSCPVEGQFCGAEACQIDPCAFCNIIVCSGGVWQRIEVPPLPPDQCKLAGE